MLRGALEFFACITRSGVSLSNANLKSMRKFPQNRVATRVDEAIIDRFYFI